MKENKVLEQEMAEMTEEQKDKIVKIGKTAMAVQLIGGIPLMIISLITMYMSIMASLSLEIEYADTMLIVALVMLAITAAYFVGVLIFVKVKFPYYSDKKWNYISKERKANKK